ncbi:MaoC family dehydratase [Caballeronia novacaledonica]|uniref:MaoC family dehydratase n=1 Tax=Caballeronia novacaledonica TaxID=1544861 RepID=A0AA37ID23_9BURK|nr:MaoC family dehydratase [Caballeronia novacaledonica]GJH27019.1 MaoC family dehydratase [Caballeronia novacaledonica]
MTDTTQRHPRGGLYFEEFRVGRVFRHGVTRTVTQADNLLYCALTLNPQPLHIDAHFCATEMPWGKPVVNSLYTLGLMVGISVYDTTMGTTVSNLGMSEIRFHTPVFDGDTVRVETEIVGARESKSNPDRGIVDFMHRAFNQDDKLIGECRRQGMILKAPE